MSSSGADNPPQRKKSFVILVGALCLFNGMLSASLPGGYEEYIGRHFVVESQEQLVLPITMYQLGFLVGSLVFGPLSERYGRGVIIVGSNAGFVVFVLASIFAPNWPAFLVFRWVLGVCGSPAITVTGGLTADVFDDVRTRGRANALYTCVSVYLHETLQRGRQAD